MKPNSHLTAQPTALKSNKGFLPSLHSSTSLPKWPVLSMCRAVILSFRSMSMRHCLGHSPPGWLSHALYLLLCHRSKWLGCFLSWLVRKKDEKLTEVKTPWVCKVLPFSELTEQELKHSQENRWKCSPLCTALHTKQAYKGAKKTASQKLQCSMRCWDSLSSSDDC